MSDLTDYYLGDFVVGGQFTLEVFTNSDATAPVQYQWFIDDVAIPGAVESTYTHTVLAGQSHSSFRALVQNPCGQEFTQYWLLGDVTEIPPECFPYECDAWDQAIFNLDKFGQPDSVKGSYLSTLGLNYLSLGSGNYLWPTASGDIQMYMYDAGLGGHTPARPSLIDACTANTAWRIIWRGGRIAFGDAIPSAEKAYNTYAGMTAASWPNYSIAAIVRWEDVGGSHQLFGNGIWLEGTDADQGGIFRKISLQPRIEMNFSSWGWDEWSITAGGSGTGSTRFNPPGSPNINRLVMYGYNADPDNNLITAWVRFTRLDTGETAYYEHTASIISPAEWDEGDRIVGPMPEVNYAGADQWGLYISNSGDATTLLEAVHLGNGNWELAANDLNVGAQRNLDTYVPPANCPPL